MKFNIFKALFYLTFVLIFLTHFVIYIIPNTMACFQVALPFCIAFYLLFIYKLKFFQCFLKKIYKIRIVKYYFLFIFLTILNIFIHVIFGFYKADLSYYVVRIYRFYVVTVLYYFIPVIGIYMGINIKNIIKMLIFMLYAVMFIGVVEFISIKLNIVFIQNILSFFTNFRDCLYALHLYSDASKMQARIHSIYGEPSAVGQLIFIVMPIIYNFAISKYKIFKNNFLNNFIQKSILPLMFITIYLTMSPIYLILNICEIFILVLLQIKKHYIFTIGLLLTVFITSLVSIAIFDMFDFDSYSNLAIDRILITISCFGDLDNLVILEPSLANRLISYTHQYIAFWNNPILGVGWNNVECYLNKHIMSSSLPLTKEIIMNFNRKQNLAGVNTNIVSTVLAEGGIIIFGVLCAFFIKQFNTLRKIAKKLPYAESNFCHSLSQSHIAIAVIAFYNLSLDNINLWILLGISLSCTYYYKYSINTHKVEDIHGEQK